MKKMGVEEEDSSTTWAGLNASCRAQQGKGTTRCDMTSHDAFGPSVPLKLALLLGLLQLLNSMILNSVVECTS
jgi:hypothetical protein